MAWVCTCGERDESDNLNFPMMHDDGTPSHTVTPDTKTTLRWGRALGVVE